MTTPTNQTNQTSQSGVSAPVTVSAAINAANNQKKTIARKRASKKGVVRYIPGQSCIALGKEHSWTRRQTKTGRLMELCSKCGSARMVKDTTTPAKKKTAAKHAVVSTSSDKSPVSQQEAERDLEQSSPHLAVTIGTKALRDRTSRRYAKAEAARINGDGRTPNTEIRCPNVHCGALNPIFADFCKNCGYNFGAMKNVPEKA
ncbi:MAG TPA: hypothetical protein VEP90_28375 [Methylomirabilota bacterium]|nr:hypothetical protein [Methylomirabilota bacterium]